MEKIVFICTGNTCRSPMAEGIFKLLLEQRGIKDIEVSSAGLFACAGAPPTVEAVEAAAHLGADIGGHRARPFSSYEIDDTRLFVCMTREHMLLLSRLVPQEKIRLLGEEIPDPFGLDGEAYDECAIKIKNGLEQLMEELR